MTTLALPSLANDAPPAWSRWLLALMLFACFFLATQDLASPLLWRDDGGADINQWVGNVESGRATRQLGFLALAAFGCLGLVVPAREPTPRRVVWPVLYPLVAIVAWAYLSILWSDDRGLTAKRLVVFTAMWTAVAAVVKHYRPRDLVRAMVVYGVGVLILGVYAEWTHRGQAGSEAWRYAGTSSPNHAGLTVFLLALAMLYGIGRRGWRGPGVRWRWALLGVALLVLWLTRSRTSLAIALLGLGVQGALMLRPSRAVAATIAGGIAVAGVLFLVETGVLGPVWEAALMGRENSDVRTLTGRTDIWGFAIDRATDDPARVIIGHGHDTFWTADRTDAVSRRVGFTISEGHNAYLEAWLNLGLVGLVAWPAAVIGGGLAWLAHGRREDGLWSPEAALACGLCVAVLVHGVAESTFTHAQFATFVLFSLIAFAALPREEPT